VILQLYLDTQYHAPTFYDTYVEDITNKSSCGPMLEDQDCHLNWIINATGAIDSIWAIDVNFSSSLGLVSADNTSDAYVQITTQNIVEIFLSQALIDGIMFDTVFSNTFGNPARNNSHPETRYNVTVGPSSTQNLDFYVKLNETFETGIYVNETSSITSDLSDFSINTTVADSWTILGNSTSNCTGITIGNNCWMRLYFDVGQEVPPGYKQKNYTICGVVAGTNPTICG